MLVEGVSDQRALEALARRRGRDLGAEGISIVSIGGSKNIGRALERFGPAGSNRALAGLCDVGEEREPHMRQRCGQAGGRDIAPLLRLTRRRRFTSASTTSRTS